MKTLILLTTVAAWSLFSLGANGPAARPSSTFAIAQGCALTRDHTTRLTLLRAVSVGSSRAWRAARTATRN